MASIITAEQIRNIKNDELVALHKLTEPYVWRGEEDQRRGKVRNWIPTQMDPKQRDEIVKAGLTLGRYYFTSNINTQDLPEAYFQLKLVEKYHPYAHFLFTKLLISGVNDWDWEKNHPIVVIEADIHEYKRYQNAVKEFQKPVYLDNVLALECLGYCYENGMGGLNQNLEKALEQYDRAVKLGNCFEEAEIGRDRCLGLLDEFKLKQIKERALNGDDPQAQYQLAQRYALGKGVQQCNKKVLHYLQLATCKNYAPAQHWLGDLYLTGLYDLPEKGGEQTKPQILLNKNEKEAFKHFYSAAQQGDAKAEYQMGRCFEKGIGIEQNLNAAVNWYLRAAAQKNIHACHSLAKLCLRGKIANLELGLRILEKTAELNCAVAQYDLGLIYYHGKYAIKDLNLAYKWVKAAEGQGFKLAKTLLVELTQKLKDSVQSKALPQNTGAPMQVDLPTKYQSETENSLLGFIKTLQSSVLKAKAEFSEKQPENSIARPTQENAVMKTSQGLDKSPQKQQGSPKKLGSPQKQQGSPQKQQNSPTKSSPSKVTSSPGKGTKRLRPDENALPVATPDTQTMQAAEALQQLKVSPQKAELGEPQAKKGRFNQGYNNNQGMNQPASHSVSTTPMFTQHQEGKMDETSDKKPSANRRLFN